MSEHASRSAADLVEEYLESEVPSLELLRELVRRREEAVPLLVEVLLVRPPDREPGDDRSYPDLRAAWLLFHLRPPEALPAFERVMLDPDREDVSICFEWDFLVFGAAAFPVLRTLCRSEGTPQELRETATRDLAHLGRLCPELREEAVEVLRGTLENAVPTRGEPERVRIAGESAMGLLGLGDEPSVPLIKDLERAREFRRDPEIRERVREWLRGWRTLSAKGAEPVEFDLIEMHGQMLWMLGESEYDEEDTCCECGCHLAHDDAPPEPPAPPIRREDPKIGRNDPCPCASGKKYKLCCGR